MDPKHSMWIGRIMYVRQWGRDNATTRQEVMHQRAIFFLTIIDMIRNGVLDENKIYYNLLFETKYSQTWQKYHSVWCFRDNLLYPLVQLNEEDFYSLVPVSRDFADIVNNKKDWNIGDWYTYVKYGKLDDELFGLLNNPLFAASLSEALKANLVVKKEAGKSAAPAAKKVVAKPAAKATKIAAPKPVVEAPMERPPVKIPIVWPRTGVRVEPQHIKPKDREEKPRAEEKPHLNEVCYHRQPRRIEEAKEGRKTWAKVTMCSLWIEELMEMDCELCGCLLDPNKPIFILSVLDLIARKKIHMNRIFFDTLLGDTFARLWEQYVPKEWNFERNLTRAYTGLAGELYYKLVPVFQEDAAELRRTTNWTPTEVQGLVAYSEFDEELFSIMNIPRFAADIKEAIIEKFITRQAEHYNNILKKEAIENNELAKSQEVTESTQVTENKEVTVSNAPTVNTKLHFKSYLSSLEDYNGKPYPPNRVDAILRTLYSIDMQRALNRHLNGMKIGDVVRIVDLDKLISRVVMDVLHGIVGNDILMALRFYREFRLQEDYQ